jgi:hypothetical protein
MGRVTAGATGAADADAGAADEETGADVAMGRVYGMLRAQPRALADAIWHKLLPYIPSMFERVRLRCCRGCYLASLVNIHRKHVSARALML